VLVLTRKLMEKLYIGDEICITVVRLEGGQVRLGIEAPRTVSVVRAELVDGRDRDRGASTLARRITSQVDMLMPVEPELQAAISLLPSSGPTQARGIGILRRVQSR
jgi:carbon storage regulator CsrA